MSLAVTKTYEVPELYDLAGEFSDVESCLDIGALDEDDLRDIVSCLDRIVEKASEIAAELKKEID